MFEILYRKLQRNVYKSMLRSKVGDGSIEVQIRGSRSVNCDVRIMTVLMLLRLGVAAEDDRRIVLYPCISAKRYLFRRNETNSYYVDPSSH